MAMAKVEIVLYRMLKTFFFFFAKKYYFFFAILRNSHSLPMYFTKPVLVVEKFQVFGTYYN